jgi:RNA polymerase sigma factor (sigma-70 family)
MKIAPQLKRESNTSDAELVIASLGGDRKAFGHIVSRYQGLLCALAYSTVGDVAHSEDIAQEAFVEAWKKLDSLREPEKLKPWLCGILRFKVSHFHRREANQPIKGATLLDEHGEHESDEVRTEDMAIREEEQALLWQAMANVPENYREPLILYYRENRSIRHVAHDLNLSEDSVKQRLSRGRKLVKEGLLPFVEGALEKSGPGAAFTTGVLAAIATIPPAAKAAALGSAAAAKASSWFGWANVLTTPAAFSGVVSAFFGFRASLDQSRTASERRNVIRITATLFFYPFLVIAAIYILRQLALGAGDNMSSWLLASQCIIAFFVVSYLFLVVGMLRSTRVLRALERERQPEAFRNPADRIGSRQREYKSQRTLFGVPLLHFRFGMPEKDDKAVFGWVAGGDRAYGLLFAWGGIAVAPVSVGILSLGVVGVGAVGLGVLGLGTVGLGFIGFGAIAVAYKAYAWISSLGWQSAFSQGFAAAHDGAIGPIAAARHVNTEQAAEIVNLATFGQGYLWALAAIVILVIVPAVWHSNSVRRRMGVERA